jgi:hypothetical protein
VLPACSRSPEPEAPPPVAISPVVPPPPVFMDVLPEFKKNARAFLDMAKKLDEAAAAKPTPTYPVFWKEYEPLDETYAKVMDKEPKSGPGASALERIGKIRDSLHKTKLILKNAEELKSKQMDQLLETEAGKRKPFLEEAEFYWKQTPEFTKKDSGD